MSIQTQNAVKLFMSLQEVRSFFDPDALPGTLNTGLNDLIAKADETITIRKELGI